MSAESQPADKLIGQILAERYQILAWIGAGAMGVVYSARHIKVGRQFAVKILHRHLIEDAKTALRFEREAELAGRLRHPNVVGVVDVGELDGLRYMVMDLAEGPDLAQLLGEAPMPPDRIIHLIRQLLEGLYHAHEQGLIHRDLKPENVIVERDSHGAELPRIVDFGIAILRDGGGEGRLTTNGLVLGTPHYMAPEQAVADPIDHRIDLFALGIMIYEMLCGRLPFDGSGAEIARANLLLDPPAIAVRVPYLEVDPLLEAFSRRLMAKKAAARPATAKAARELLDLIASDRPAAAAALGISPALSARVPATTRPATPQTTRRLRPTPQAEPSGGRNAPTPLDPPSLRAPPSPSEPPRVTPAQAAFDPALDARVSDAPPSPRIQPDHKSPIQTPVGWIAARPMRQRRLIAVGFGLAAAAAVAAVVLAAAGGSADQVAARPAAAAEVSSAAATDIVARASDPQPPDPTQLASMAPPVGPDNADRAERKPAEAKTADITATAPAPTETRPAPTTNRTRAADRPAHEPTAGSTKAHGAVGARTGAVDVKVTVDLNVTDSRSDAKLGSARPADTRIVEPRSAEPRPAEPRPDDAGSASSAAGSKPPAMTPAAVSNLYTAVLRDLEHVPDGQVDDLMARWRQFNVQSLMLASQTDRDQAGAQLLQIQREARRRQKAARPAP